MTAQVCGFDLEHLHGPEEVSYAEDELVVVCLVRDGLPWVRSFVEHYFSLGSSTSSFWTTAPPMALLRLAPATTA